MPYETKALGLGGWRCARCRSIALGAYIFTFWVLLSQLLHASQTLTLAWDPSPSPDVAGYVVYYGTVSGVYDHRLDIHTNTIASITDLKEGEVYYFVVAAYDQQGVESAPSNEVSYLVPGLVELTLNSTNSYDELLLRTSVVWGRTYKVQASTNLVYWTTILQTNAFDNDWMEFPVPRQDTPMLFYRVVQE